MRALSRRPSPDLPLERSCRVLFFFSSRRRHTRLQGDWSSDVCSSDLFRDLVSERLPLIFGFVFSLAFLLLLFTFRSIVIPIKAILLNLLSVDAAYVVIVLDFHVGCVQDLLDFI